MQVIPNLKVHLYKRWKFFFSGLILFWLFVMIIFSAGLISMGGDYRRFSNIRRTYISRLQYPDDDQLENMSINDPLFGLFYKLEKPLSADFKNFTDEGDNSSAITDDISENRLLDLRQEGNLTKDFELNLTESDEVNTRTEIETVASDVQRGISNDTGIKDDFFRFQWINRHHKPVIQDLPRDKISEQQINDVKKKFWIKNEIPPKALKGNGFSGQNEAVYERHVDTPIMAKNMLPNNQLLQQNRNLFRNSQINLRTADNPMMSPQNRLLKLQKEKSFIYSRPGIRDYRQKGYLFQSLPFQQPDKKQAFQAQRNRIYNRFPINGAQQKLSQSNSFLNAKYHRNPIFQRQNGNAYKGQLFGILSQNRPVLRNALLQEPLKHQLLLRQRGAQYNSQRQALLQQGRPWLRHQPVNAPFKSQLFQKQSGNINSKQGLKTWPLVGSLKETFIARNMSKNSVYQQQRRNAYDWLAREAGPKYRPLLRNPVTNYQLNNNLMQKQSGHFYGRDRLNVLSQDRPVLQKLLISDSLNRRPVQPQSGNVYNEQKINFKQTIRDNTNYRPAAQFEPQNQAVLENERVQGSLNKGAGQNMYRLVRWNGDGISDRLKAFKQRLLTEERPIKKLTSSTEQQNGVIKWPRELPAQQNKSPPERQSQNSQPRLPGYLLE